MIRFKHEGKSAVILFLGFLTCVFILQVNPVTAYWDGDGGDCRDYHGITYMDCSHDGNPGISIDGIANETAWDARMNNSRTVPAASMNESTYFFLTYINLTILRDDTWVYLLMKWNDSNIGHIQDEIDICWNINMDNFTAYFAGGMNTTGEEQRVDTWGWNKLNYDNGSIHPGKDQCFGTNGWYDRADENQDIDTGYTMLNEGGVDYYQVEMRRKLITNDEYDVQFTHDGLYELNFAVIDDMGHEDHAVSWNYAVNFQGLPGSKKIPGSFMLTWGVILGSIGIACLRARKGSIGKSS